MREKYILGYLAARLKLHVLSNHSTMDGRWTGSTFRNDKKYTYRDSIRNPGGGNQISGESTRPRRSSVPFFRISGDRFHLRFFFIYRCLSSKTHASHHYKIADYSRSRRGAAGPFYPFRLDRLERGIENGSERSGLRVRDRETPTFGRRRKKRVAYRRNKKSVFEGRTQRTMRRRGRERERAGGLGAW